MAIVYREDIGPFTGKGSALTIAENDGNFFNLDTRVDALEDGGAFGLDTITYTGGSITFNWSDATTSGPFLLPIATFVAKGVWLPTTAYTYLDIVSVFGQGTYLVMQNHTSASTFNPAATQGGNPLYQIIGEAPDYASIMYYRGNFIPGFLYEVDDVFLDSTYGLFRVAIRHVSSGTFDPLATQSGLPLYTQIAGPSFSSVITTAENTYTISTSDRGRYLRFQQTCIITFPELPTMPLGSEIHFEQAGDEDLAFIPDDEMDVTILPQRMGYSTATPYRGAVVTAKYVDDNTWKLIGPHGDETSS